MSVFKDPQGRSPFWQCRYSVNGKRFQRSTECTSRRDAEAKERELIREEEQRQLDEAEGGKKPLNIMEAVLRYAKEKKNLNADVLKGLKRVAEDLGHETMIAAIDGEDLERLIELREGEKGRKRGSIKTGATINRLTLHPLKRLLAMATRKWGQKGLKDISWSDYMQAEKDEHPRYVLPHEEAMLKAAFSPEFYLFVRFARVSGLRLSEALLRKDQVDLDGDPRFGIEPRVRYVQKGGKKVEKPISKPMRAILMEAMANPTNSSVFTVVSHGRLFPLTYEIVQATWMRARHAKAIPDDLRFHDLRHDFATRLLLATGNLKLVQKAMGHSRIETTARYAHILKDDILDAMNLLDGTAGPRRLSMVEAPVAEADPQEGGGKTGGLAN